MAGDGPHPHAGRVRNVCIEDRGVVSRPPKSGIRILQLTMRKRLIVGKIGAFALGFLAAVRRRFGLLHVEPFVLVWFERSHCSAGLFRLVRTEVGAVLGHGRGRLIP